MTDQKFCTSHAKDAEWKPGLRGFFEYRDLGIGEATNGAVHAHVIRLGDQTGDGPRHTGQHQHILDFQMFYVLKGWIKFAYEGYGKVTFNAGDCCLQPPGIVHDEVGCSDDVELIEITSPAEFETKMI